MAQFIPASMRGVGVGKGTAAPLLLTGVLLSGLLVGTRAVVAGGEPLSLPLQCRLGQGPWLPCRMEVQDVGLHWFLLIGSQRIEFRHGGDGAVRMLRGEGPWRPVTAQWQADTSLCWDGVCAKGEIPLD